MRPRPPVRHVLPPQPQPQQQSDPELSQFVDKALSMGIPSQFARQAIMDTVGANMKHISWFSWEFFRYYFRVNNRYVLQKIKLVFFPYLHDSWNRIEDQMGNQNQKVVYKPPSQDVTAPDLYIPMMSFLTYILVMGYILGMDGNFHPDVLGFTATGALVVLFLENLCLNLAYYLLSVSNSPPILDSIAYTSYKFVPVNTGLLAWVFLGDFAYYIIATLVGISYGMFLTRSLGYIFLPKQDVQNQSKAFRSRRNTFLLIFGLVQVPLSMYLSRTSKFTRR